jgi:hypothetical protein
MPTKRVSDATKAAHVPWRMSLEDLPCVPVIKGAVKSRGARAGEVNASQKVYTFPPPSAARVAPSLNTPKMGWGAFEVGAACNFSPPTPLTPLDFPVAKDKSSLFDLIVALEVPPKNTGEVSSSARAGDKTATRVRTPIAYSGQKGIVEGEEGREGRGLAFAPLIPVEEGGEGR